MRLAMELPAHAPLADEALDALVTVLDEIRLGRSRSRSELVARTGLGRAIVAQRVGELVDRGLVIEGDVGPSTGGRPPRRLTFRADAGHVLVADLGATSIDVAAHRARRADPRPSRRAGAIEAGPEAVPRPGRRAVRVAPADDQGHPRTPVGDRHRGARARSSSSPGRPISPPIMPGWDGYPIRERFAARYDAPVWVDNDVNLLALGEWRSGVAAGHDNVVVVKVGTGIGAGHHLGRPSPSRRPGQRRRRRPHPGHRRPGRRLPLRQHRLPRGAGRWRRRSAGPARRPPRRAGRARLRLALDQRGTVTAQDVARAASFGDPVAVALLQVGRPADRIDARERRQLLQPVAGRDRRRRRQQPGPVPRVDPRDRLPAVAPARDARPAHPALVARRPRRRHRRVLDGRRPAVRARVDRRAGSRPATRLPPRPSPRRWPADADRPRGHRRGRGHRVRHGHLDGADPGLPRSDRRPRAGHPGLGVSRCGRVRSRRPRATTPSWRPAGPSVRSTACRSGSRTSSMSPGCRRRRARRRSPHTQPTRTRRSSRGFARPGRHRRQDRTRPSSPIATRRRRATRGRRRTRPAARRPARRRPSRRGWSPARSGRRRSARSCGRSAYCGVVGLKGGHGAVPLDGVVPLAWSLDHAGAIARSVADAALLIAVLAGTPVVPTRTAAPRLGVDRAARSTRAEPACASISRVCWRGWPSAGAVVRTSRCRRPSPTLPMPAGAPRGRRRRDPRRTCSPSPRRRTTDRRSASSSAPGWRATPEDLAERARGPRDGARGAFADPRHVRCAADPGRASTGPAARRTAPATARCARRGARSASRRSALPTGLDADGLPFALQLVGGRGPPRPAPRRGDLVRARRRLRGRPGV